MTTAIPVPNLLSSGHAYNPYLPWVGTAIAVGYAVYLTLKSRSDAQNGGKSCVNQCVRKDADKVVDSLDVEDLPNKAVFCRCWKSEKVTVLAHHIKASQHWQCH